MAMDHALKLRSHEFGNFLLLLTVESVNSIGSSLRSGDGERETQTAGRDRNGVNAGQKTIDV